MGAQTGPVTVDEFGQYPCKLCGRTFETVSGLGGHRRRCTVALAMNSGPK